MQREDLKLEEEREEELEPDLPETDELHFSRESKATVECFSCGSRTEKKFSNSTPYLVIEGQEDYVAFCPLHEGELLMWLLANRVKRMGKGKKLLPLSKTTTLKLINEADKEEWVLLEDEDVPSVLERLGHA